MWWKALLISVFVASATAVLEPALSIDCDVVIAGGTTAALSAALSAAGTSPELQVCLLEPTDWAGGQLTASAVSAIDYGRENAKPANQPLNFQNLVSSVGGVYRNLGACWVSLTCYEPQLLVDSWIIPAIEALTNLKVFYYTVPKAVTTNGMQEIETLTAIQRTPITATPWNTTLSAQISDWYDPADSSAFTKSVIQFTGKTFIDGTEWGELLVLSNASWSQGVEAPAEDELQSPPPPLDTCGQETVYPFYMHLLTEPAPKQHVPSPPPEANYSISGYTWGQVWTYRRSVAAPTPQPNGASFGEVSNQDWGGGVGGNDWPFGYLFIADAATRAQRSDWMGGVDVKQLDAAERNAFGFFSFMKANAPPQFQPNLWLDVSGLSGTTHGLSKVPYVRDTRRSVGINDFRLMYWHLNGSTNASATGFKFDDRIGIGDYLYTDIHHMSGCEYPPYLSAATTKPYYLPFRALTNRDISNLVLAGKTMAQSFHANGATRLHPVEWSSGLAAGIAAAMMAANDWSTSDVYNNHISQLQSAITSFGGVIEWTL